MNKSYEVEKHTYPKQLWCCLWKHGGQGVEHKILHPTLLTRNNKYAAQAVPLLFNAINERQRFATSRILARRQSHSQVPEMNDSSTVKRGTDRPLRGSRIQWRWWWRSPFPFFRNSIDPLSLRSVPLLSFLNRPVRRMQGRVVGD